MAEGQLVVQGCRAGAVDRRGRPPELPAPPIACYVPRASAGRSGAEPTVVHRTRHRRPRQRPRAGLGHDCAVSALPEQSVCPRREHSAECRGAVEEGSGPRGDAGAPGSRRRIDVPRPARVPQLRHDGLKGRDAVPGPAQLVNDPRIAHLSRCVASRSTHGGAVDRHHTGGVQAPVRAGGELTADIPCRRTTCASSSAIAWGEQARQL